MPLSFRLENKIEVETEKKMEVKVLMEAETEV
jgi:hypothetical protein